MFVKHIRRNLDFVKIKKKTFNINLNIADLATLHKIIFSKLIKTRMLSILMKILARNFERNILRLKKKLARSGNPVMRFRHLRENYLSDEIFRENRLHPVVRF